MSNAGTAIWGLRYSPDVTVELGGATVSDAGLADDLFGSTVAPTPVVSLPPGVDLAAHQLLVGGALLFAVDASVLLPTGMVIEPADVVRYDGALYQLAFDGSAAGVPRGARVDAVTLGPSGELVLSFDVAVEIGGTLADDEDLVHFEDGALALWFDGSASGVPQALDLDAAHRVAATGGLLLSFDQGGRIAGIDFDDEDVLERTTAGAWELAYDGSAQHAGWVAADLDALHAFGPEPRCADGLDNDGDGRIDFPADPQCTSLSGARERACGLGFEVAPVLAPLALLRARRRSGCRWPATRTATGTSPFAATMSSHSHDASACHTS